MYDNAEVKETARRCGDPDELLATIQSSLILVMASRFMFRSSKGRLTSARGRNIRRTLKVSCISKGTKRPLIPYSEGI